jgi:hypothetical protein
MMMIRFEREVISDHFGLVPWVQKVQWVPRVSVQWVLECLADGVDRGYFTHEQIVPLQRPCKRVSKAATGLIAYLKTADPPNEEPRRRRTHGRRNPRNPNERRNLREPKNPKNPKNLREPPEQKPSEPPEPIEPMEPMD